jgi:PAS domain S-box-containing protein
MKLLHDLPIRRKVMLVMMLTTGVALLLACTALLSYELREFRHKLESDLATLGQVIGANSSAAISFDDEQAATEMLTALRAEPQIVAARIYRQGGQPLAGYIRPGATAALPDKPNGTTFFAADDRLHHFAPIEDPREQVQAGTIYLAAEFGGMRDRVKSYAGLLGVVLVASGLVAFALSAKLQTYISGPILNLAETTRKVSDEGNYSLRAVRETEDEIGDLIVSFNEMLAQIQHRDAELHAAHDHLERRVQERTAELQQEVTVRARAEEDLARSLSLVTATLEATADGILVVDGDGWVVSYNQKFASMWRIPPEVLESRSDEELLACVRSQLKDPDTYVEKVKALYDDPSAPVEDIVEFLDGRVFERYSQPHRVHGHTVGRVWSFRDITARNKAEEQIREQASLLDLAQDAILIRDLDDEVLFWNKGAERLYGWQAEEVLGSQMGKLFHKDPARFLGAKSIVVARNEWSGELAQFTKNGSEVVSESRWTLLRDESGAPKSILVINTDITERKKLEGQFLRAQRMESIGTLAGGIAHDLNNVLAPILMSIDLLRREFTDGGADQVLEAIELSALRGADLVRQILYFARGAEGKRMAVKPQRVLNEVFKIARDTFPKKHLTPVPLPIGPLGALGRPDAIPPGAAQPRRERARCHARWWNADDLS